MEKTREQLIAENRRLRAIAENAIRTAEEQGAISDRLMDEIDRRVADLSRAAIGQAEEREREAAQWIESAKAMHRRAQAAEAKLRRLRGY